MKTQIKRMIISGLFLALTIIAGLYLSGTMKVADAADKVEQGPAACLACHGGSFDKLVDKKPAFKAPSDEIVNPHQYIPHNQKIAENVPDCTGCHSKHPIPPKEEIDLSKVNVDSCFQCHHEQNFRKCKTCHRK
jgi:hypothetical protein